MPTYRFLLTETKTREVWIPAATKAEAAEEAEHGFATILINNQNPWTVKHRHVEEVGGEQ